MYFLLQRRTNWNQRQTQFIFYHSLFKRKYIEKKKKNLYATETGMNLIHVIKNDLLKSPELTGQWEHKLRMMEKGQYDPAQFKAELYKMVRELTDQVIFDH